ncbi:coiled-coil domain-containing protein 167 isoform X1 [Centrocercus urophasianus]|uniref:coiled-coil domain-containing protein 167 isoform X1 n=1 Tax=Centrocercus urophasianus TaxID=9002 RepID=UPI001C652323|nr:coiled-coil domain-containing protein 167 isoform X1 [Centrocercus urophasianus]
MGRKREGLSVAREIDELEEKLSLCRQSMEEVDLKLRREKLSHEGRKSLERERNLLMTKADNYAVQAPKLTQGTEAQVFFKAQRVESQEKELSVLRKENRKNAALAVAMVLLIALIYTCWTM